MSVWHVEGGNRLTGSVTVLGAKNAVLPIMAASVLAPGETELLNVPELRDCWPAAAAQSSACPEDASWVRGR